MDWVLEAGGGSGAGPALASLIPSLMAAGVGGAAMGAGGAPVPCPLCGFESGSWLESLAHFHLAHATALLLPSAMAAIMPSLAASGGLSGASH